uniref:Uncharacterized protein n=1 Tax=Cacopsylla melanoneura TaxID=428564 RepID=A0A8D8Y1K7_9HEMI
MGCPTGSKPLKLHYVSTVLISKRMFLQSLLPNQIMFLQSLFRKFRYQDSRRDLLIKTWEGAEATLHPPPSQRLCNGLMLNNIRQQCRSISTSDLYYTKDKSNSGLSN